MINIDIFHKQLDAKLKVFEWVLTKPGIHCLTISLGFKLSPDRICELYNMKLDYFYGKVETK